MHVEVPDHSIGFGRDADQQAVGTTPRARIVRIQLTPILPHQISSLLEAWPVAIPSWPVAPASWSVYSLWTNVPRRFKAFAPIIPFPRFERCNRLAPFNCPIFPTNSTVQSICNRSIASFFPRIERCNRLAQFNYFIVPTN